MRGAKLIVVLFLMSVLPIPAAQAFHEAPPEHPHKIAWQTPDNFTGDLVLEIGLDLGADNECLFYTGLTGRDTGPGLHAAYMFDSGGWGTFSSGSLVHAHTGLVDTRDLTAFGGGSWGVESWRWGRASGNDTFTVAGFGLAPWLHGGVDLPPLIVEVSCAQPFEVTSRAGSTQVVGFTIDSLDGGTGASADTFFGPEVNLNVEDSVEAHLDTARVEVDVFSFSTTSVGQVTLAHPEGQERYLLGGGHDAIEHVGPGGGYVLTVDRVSASWLDVFWGLMAGLDDVAHFDELVA